ncbi:F-actin-capping protein-like protein subunit alpha-1 [Geopyxis carbonaria]|nr:F-actin-capping protein-like protein subunit alpha-1 [Geopyxis carbonaria]
MQQSEATEIASGFILDAPPGELQDVMADVKSLIGNEDSILKELQPSVEKYNKEQLITIVLPGSSQRVIVSEFNELSNGRFFDVESQSSWVFDHTSQKASDVQSYACESQNADTMSKCCFPRRKSILHSLAPHVQEHYPSSPASGVYPTSDDSGIAIVIVGNKYSPGNYWNGRWRSIYIFHPSTNSLSGEIKVDVHYYEDGNVRLLTTKAVSITTSTGSATEVVKLIAAEEKSYQQELNSAFGRLSEGAFKNLRRQLPITRQKIDWEKIGSYRLGQDIGGARGSR